jgi:hypothetical protein
MNKQLASLAAAVLLSASSLVPALATDVRLQATREKFATNCQWVPDSRHPGTHRLRMLSFAPFFPIGEKAAFVAKIGDAGARLQSFSFEIHYTSQLSRHVAPSVVLEIRDPNNKPEYRRVELRDLDRKSAPGNRELITFDLAQKYRRPVTVSQIAIGGNEQVISGNPHTMDCSICDFRAFDANGVRLTNTTDLDPKVINKRENPLLLPGHNLGSSRPGPVGAIASSQ